MPGRRARGADPLQFWRPWRPRLDVSARGEGFAMGRVASREGGSVLWRKPHGVHFDGCGGFE